MRDERALAIIVLSVADDQLVHVAGKQKAKAAWDSLSEVYAQKTAGSLIAITRQLYRTVIHPGESVRRHINKLTECFQMLEQRGKMTLEEDRVFILLSSLSEEYNMLIMALESVETDKLTFQYVTGRLLEQERRLESGKPAKSGKPARMERGVECLMGF